MAAKLVAPTVELQTKQARSMQAEKRARLISFTYDILCLFTFRFSTENEPMIWTTNHNLANQNWNKMTRLSLSLPSSIGYR
jgi:hypothetical protein